MCEICSSFLLDDVNKKINWRPDRVVKWAGRRGLVINEKQLEDHFEKHIDSASPNKRKAGKNISRKKKADPEMKAPSAKPVTHKEQPVVTPESSDKHNPTDDRFLAEIIGQVFGSLVEGNYSLKIEHGFKAIELKQKLSENSNVETLLLDLLNEIRRQELADNNNSN